MPPASGVAGGTRVVGVFGDFVGSGWRFEWATWWGSKPPINTPYRILTIVGGTEEP